jgi:hypothetical protein
LLGDPHKAQKFADKEEEEEEGELWTGIFFSDGFLC